MALVDPRLDPVGPAVERDLGAERPIANPLPSGTVVDLDALDKCIHDPACIARVHDDDRCRPETACWIIVDDVPHHVSHAGRCWHEIVPRVEGDPEGAYIQSVVVEPDAPGPVVPAADVEPTDDGPSDDVPPVASSDAPVVNDETLEYVGGNDPRIETMIEELYARLRAEGNPPQLSITLATLYAEWKLADVPATMSMLQSLATTIGGVLGGGDGSGFLAKMVGKAMRGNAQ